MVTLVALALFAAGGLAIATIADQAEQADIRLEQKANITRAEKVFTNKLKEYGIDEDFDAIKVYEDMYNTGFISKDEYTKGVKVLKKLSETTGTGFLGGSNQDWVKIRMSQTEANELIQLYSRLTEHIPEIKHATSDAIKDLPNQMQQQILENIPDITAPDYLDTSFKGYQREVDPVKLWRGEELANLHNIDFDPNSYYDLIKATTSAAVDYGKYTSEQMNQASMVNDTDTIVPYLDSIRNTKAEAIANGSTIGAQRANELLSNLNQLNSYATAQNDVAAQRYDTLDSLLLQDASAKLTARNYFDQLAQSLANDSAILYANDTARFGQDWRTNADMYTADQNLRGTRAAANGAMYGAYAQAQARVDAARGGINNQFNEYAWLLDRFAEANDWNYNKAFDQLNSHYIFNGYSGYDGPLDYVLASNKK